jgi:hypothetical protein
VRLDEEDGSAWVGSELWGSELLAISAGGGCVSWVDVLLSFAIR